MEGSSQNKQPEDSMPLLRHRVPPTVNEGRLVLPDDFEFTEEEIHQTSTELLNLAEMCSSQELQVPEEISNALWSYKSDKTLRDAVNSAASDNNILRALVANKYVNTFLATLKEGASHLIAEFGNMHKVIVGHTSEGSDQTEAKSGNMNEARRDITTVTEKFKIAKEAFTDLLKSIWNFLVGNAGEVWESIRSTMSLMGEQVKEGFRYLIMLLLATFKRNLERRMYAALNYME